MTIKKRPWHRSLLRPAKPLVEGCPQLFKKEEIQTQFSVLKMKDGRIAVQFPVADLNSQTLDTPLALELVSAGLQTLAQVVRQQQKEKESRIEVVPATAFPPIPTK